MERVRLAVPNGDALLPVNLVATGAGLAPKGLLGEAANGLLGAAAALLLVLLLLGGAAAGAAAAAGSAAGAAAGAAAAAAAVGEATNAAGMSSSGSPNSVVYLSRMSTLLPSISALSLLTRRFT
jgi:hypothetical protein